MLDAVRNPNEALQDFTGFPTISFNLQADGELTENPDRLFKVLENYADEGYLMSGTAPGLISSGSDLSQKENQLAAGHTYSILRVKCVYSHKLVQVRNGWGGFVWDGAWSKRSLFWT
jgi:calpain-15